MAVRRRPSYTHKKYKRNIFSRLFPYYIFTAANITTRTRRIIELVSMVTPSTPPENCICKYARACTYTHGRTCMCTRNTRNDYFSFFSGRYRVKTPEENARGIVNDYLSEVPLRRLCIVRSYIIIRYYRAAAITTVTNCRARARLSRRHYHADRFLASESELWIRPRYTPAPTFYSRRDGRNARIIYSVGDIYPSDDDDDGTGTCFRVVGLKAFPVRFSKHGTNEQKRNSGPTTARATVRCFRHFNKLTRVRSEKTNTIRLNRYNSRSVSREYDSPTTFPYNNSVHASDGPNVFRFISERFIRK